MRKLICAFVVRIWQKQVLSWRGSFYIHFEVFPPITIINWAASNEFDTYRLCEQRKFRRACASAQSRQNFRCSLIQAVSQEEPSGRKPDPWPLWMAGHAQLKFAMTECSDTNSLDGAQLETWTILTKPLTGQPRTDHPLRNHSSDTLRAAQNVWPSAQGCHEIT